jgi:hypothetical protein
MKHVKSTKLIPRNVGRIKFSFVYSKITEKSRKSTRHYVSVYDSLSLSLNVSKSYAAPWAGLLVGLSPNFEVFSIGILWAR